MSQMKYRVLIVDDQIDHLNLLKHYLESDTDEFSVDIYDPIEKGMPDEDYPWSAYDLLLIDYYLRDNTAFDWMQEYEDIIGFPPVVIVTGIGDERLAVQSIKRGAIDYVDKTKLTAGKLQVVVRDAIEEVSSQYAKATVTPGAYDANTVENTLATIWGANDGRATVSFTTYDIDELTEGKRYIDKYRLTDCIAKGGMSTIYRGIDEDGDFPVAIKLLHGGITDDVVLFQRFIHEYSTLKSLVHPNIVKVYKEGHTSDYAFIAMEYLPDGDLGIILEQGINPSKAIVFAIQIAYALSEIHSRGVVHRDLKPANILLRDAETLVLADFGIAKEIIKSDSGLTLTMTGMMIGTPSYASPEQIMGEQLDSRSDQYNLGLIIYEMLTGERPFTGTNPIEVAKQHVLSPPPRLPDSLSSIQPLLNRMLAKKAKDRFTTSDDVLAELMELRLKHS